jgi:hypothetical protein
MGLLLLFFLRLAYQSFDGLLLCLNDLLVGVGSGLLLQVELFEVSNFELVKDVGLCLGVLCR